jgi:hypothetical protein
MFLAQEFPLCSEFSGRVAGFSPLTKPLNLPALRPARIPGSATDPVSPAFIYPDLRWASPTCEGTGILGFRAVSRRSPRGCVPRCRNRQGLPVFRSSYPNFAVFSIPSLSRSRCHSSRFRFFFPSALCYPPAAEGSLEMNLTRIALAALGGFVVYFVLGGLAFGLVPALRDEFLKYPAVYRAQEGVKSAMPAGMLAMFVAMIVLATIYAMLYQAGSGLSQGARFGALIGIFAICAFVIHNYVNLNIGAALTFEQSIAYFIEWLAVGMVIGVIYRPRVPR